MRRYQCQVTHPEEIQRILSSTTVGRLATNGADGYPYITPVSFVYHEGKVYFHSALAGEKLDNLKRDPRVCFEVDIPLAYLGAGSDPKGRICRLHQFYHCVIIRGQARIVSEEALKTTALNGLIAKHEGGSDSESVSPSMAGYKACEVIEITPTSLSAKSDLGQNRTDEERLVVAEYLTGRNLPGDWDVVKAMGFNPEDLRKHLIP
jgi:uncharacterized protein